MQMRGGQRYQLKPKEEKGEGRENEIPSGEGVVMQLPSSLLPSLSSLPLVFVPLPLPVVVAPCFHPRVEGRCSCPSSSRRRCCTSPLSPSSPSWFLPVSTQRAAARGGGWGLCGGRGRHPTLSSPRRCGYREVGWRSVVPVCVDVPAASCRSVPLSSFC
jgi:hypothetical protein